MKRFTLILGLIFVLAFGLRYVGIYPGYNPYHPDEPTSYGTALYMNLHNFKPDRFDYPAGMALLHAIVFRNVFIPISLLHLFITQPESIWHLLSFDPQFFDLYGRVLFGNRSVYAMYWSRAIAASIGGLTVILLYFVGKKLFTREVGLFAAFFLAINYRHVLGSHFGLPDVHNSFFALLSLFTSALLLEKNTQKRYLFAGIAAGLVFSIKYQVFAFLPPLFAHVIWTVRTKRLSYFIGKHAWIAAISAFVTFVIINPFYFPNIENAFFRNRQDIGRYQMGVLGLRIYPYFYLFHWGIDRLPAILVVIGMFLMSLRDTLKFFLMFMFVGSFFAFMTYFSNGGIFPRNFVTPMPYLMLFAGYGFSFIVKFIRSFVKPSYIYGIIVVLLLFIINFRPIKNILLLDTHYMKPWGIDMLANWFDHVLPENSTIRTYQLFMFMNYKGQDALERKKIEVLDWDYSKGPNSLAEFSRERTDFAIIQIQSLQSVTYWWRQFPRSTWLFNYREVPYDYILESFYGLTLRELLRHTVAEFYKPWQAASEFSFLVFKIPTAPLSLDRRIARFDFADATTLWNDIDPFNLSPMTRVWDSGSMQIPPGGGDATTRLVSDPIAIVGGKHYTVFGWIKNVTDKPEQEDGFLRVDFYLDSSAKTLSLTSLDVAISQRATTSGEWNQIQANAKAPEGAMYMTVSFQRKNPAFPYTSFLDNVEIYESTPAPQTFPQLPEFRSTLEWRDAFFPSFL